MTELIDHLYPTGSLGPGYQAATQAVLDARAVLVNLLRPGQTIEEYLRAPLSYQVNNDAFGGAKQLNNIITDEVRRVHGEAGAVEIAATLDRHWSVETGAHAAIPRRYDKVDETAGPQVNDLIAQGQITWAAARRQVQRTPVGISLATGIIPVSNANSGRYLDFSATCKPIGLPRSKYKAAEQSFVPPMSAAELAEKVVEIRRSTATEAEKAYGLRVLDAMSSGSSLSYTDQVLRAHAVFMDSVLPKGNHHLSVDSVSVASQFMTVRLRSEDSPLQAIFDQPDLRQRFKGQLAGIQTGWTDKTSMFQRVDRSGDVAKLREANIDHMSAGELADALDRQEVVPKTLLQYASMILEGGLCVIGGMNQANYCSQLQKQLITLVSEQLPERHDLAMALAQIPLDRAVISPAWGVTYGEQGQARLTNINDILRTPLTIDEFEGIVHLQTASSFAAALPALIKFLTNKTPPSIIPEGTAMQVGLIIRRS